MKLRCLIVDDEPLARKGMVEYVTQVPFLELAGTASRTSEAGEKLNEGVDLMLLDIQMPKQTGLEFLRTLKEPPLVIITTAFNEFALQGFELDVVDYLVKPIPFERFTKAVTKARDYFLYRQNPKQVAEDDLFVKSNGKLERVRLGEILFVEAMQNYVIIHRASGKLIVYMTMSGLERQLPSDRFMRVHKSFLVSLPNVNTIEGHTLFVGSHKIPVSRTLREEVTRRIVGKDQLRR